MFVAPVVFALAPVINTIVSLFWHPDEGAFTVGAPREPVHWSLYLGVVLAGLGAALVLAAKDLPGILAGTKTIAVNDYTFVIFVLLAGLSWGVYVPLIAQGGKDLKSSYASFLCVGAAYFVIAVVLPLAMLWYQSGQPKFHAPNFAAVAVTLATLSGAAGAVGRSASSSPPSSSRGRASTSPRSSSPWPRSSTPSSLFFGTRRRPRR